MFSSFIEDLIDFVNKEQDAQNTQIREIWGKPLNVRVHAEEAIGNITIIDNIQRGLVVDCRENYSKFRIGDRLRLHHNIPWQDFIPCEIAEENGNNIILRFIEYPYNIPVGNGWILDRDIVDVRSIQLGSLEMIANKPLWENYFAAMFRGEIKPSISSTKKNSASNLSEDLKLNSKQQEAFCNAYATDNYYLIQGPPGTGKTRIVAELAKAFATEGQRVLVTAFTHRAINNALLSIAKYTNYQKLIKIGQWQYREGLRDEEEGIDVLNFSNLIESPYEYSNEGVIIGATCFACRTKRLQFVNGNRATFDTVIFDEAGQITIPVALMAMLSSARNIFVGDHQQMAPIIVADHKNEWVKKSIFETLYGHSPGTMLEETYRMNAEICRFPSQQFYKGLLIPNNNNKFSSLLKKKPDNFASILGDESDVFVEVNHENRTTRSQEEATIVARLVWEMVSCGINPKDIAIISPYRAQGRLIRHLLNELSNTVVVDTVERIQGQQREVVILSLTTSDPSHASKRAEFYFQPNRLNVSITRSKVKRIVIGNPLIFKAHPENDKIRSWINIFKAFYDQCFKIHLDFPFQG